MSSPQHSAEKKIRTLNDLQAIKKRVLAQTALREDGYRVCVTVHMGTCGIAAGAGPVMQALQEELAACGRRDVRVTTSGCIGACMQEPVMTIEMLGLPSVLYGKLDAEKTRLIFREHVLGGNPLPQLAVGSGA